jgi:glycosyltransferase involved in cell wall biosynthesis
MVQALSSSVVPRLALVTGGLNLGGSTTFLCNLGGELVRRGVPAEVISFEANNPLAADFKRLGIPVFSQDDRHAIFEDRMRAILNELKRFSPTAVVSCLGETSFEVLRYVPTGVFRVGVIQSHDPGPYNRLWPYARYLDMAAGVSRLIVRTLESFPDWGRMPVAYLPYGVPMPEGTALPRRDPNAPLRILYLGRLTQPQKRVRLFPEILERLKASGIPFHWTVAGEGDEAGFLQAAMRTESPQQTVSFPGKVLYGDLPGLLAAHDIFLLASDSEGLPLSLLEAMGCGLVPVVSDLASGIAEVVDDTSGKRIAPENTAGYADAIIGLHQHRDELKRLSQDAQSKVRREFSLSAMADRWLAALPPARTSDVTWPDNWSILAPLGMERQFRFSPPARILRRWLIKFGKRGPKPLIPFETPSRPLRSPIETPSSHQARITPSPR